VTSKNPPKFFKVSKILKRRKKSERIKILAVKVQKKHQKTFLKEEKS